MNCRPAAIALALALAACAPPSAGAAADPVADAPAGAATKGLDPARMERVLADARALPRLHALVVARHGTVIAAHRLRGAPLDQPVNIKSASKTVLSALAGIAIGQGVLAGVDQPIAPLFRADLPPRPDPRLARITIGHLLSMQAGLGRTSGEHYGRWVSSPNWVRYALARPFEGEPGGRMQYSTGSSHLLSAALARASGRSTHRLAQDWLGAPLGIVIPPWTRDPQGVFFGGNEMRLSPLALVRFGELYRNDGVWNGRRILPEGWVRESWQPRTTSPWSGNGYGYGWFAKIARGHDVRFAWGYGGQMLFVVPDLALTVVMISDPAPHPRAESHLPELHRLLDDGIVPAAETGLPTG